VKKLISHNDIIKLVVSYTFALSLKTIFVLFVILFFGCKLSDNAPEPPSPLIRNGSYVSLLNVSLGHRLFNDIAVGREATLGKVSNMSLEPLVFSFIANGSQFQTVELFTGKDDIIITNKTQLISLVTNQQNTLDSFAAPLTIINNSNVMLHDIIWANTYKFNNIAVGGRAIKTILEDNSSILNFSFTQNGLQFSTNEQFSGKETITIDGSTLVTNLTTGEQGPLSFFATTLRVLNSSSVTLNNLNWANNIAAGNVGAGYSNPVLVLNPKISYLTFSLVRNGQLFRTNEQFSGQEIIVINDNTLLTNLTTGQQGPLNSFIARLQIRNNTNNILMYVLLLSTDNATILFYTEAVPWNSYMLQTAVIEGNSTGYLSFMTTRPGGVGTYFRTTQPFTITNGVLNTIQINYNTIVINLDTGRQGTLGSFL